MWRDLPFVPSRHHHRASASVTLPVAGAPSAAASEDLLRQNVFTILHAIIRYETGMYRK
jgi:hypothetical protein